MSRRLDIWNTEGKLKENVLPNQSNLKQNALCSIQTKGIQNAQNWNLQTFPLATAQLFFVMGLLIVNTVSSLMSFIEWRNSFKT
jgi:hypothetical protein